MTAKRVILGGTFHELHKGHERLLRTALDMGHVTIGLVSDEFLSRWKPQLDAPFQERKEALERYLTGYDSWEIIDISDPWGDAVDGDYHTIVVSWDTQENGMKINQMRKERGKGALEMVVVPPVLARDLIPLSSTRIRQGRIDHQGERLMPVKVRVGTDNPTKIRAVEKVFSRLFDVVVDGSCVKGTEKQPMDIQTIDGARTRAEVPPGYDYGVGIESGIFNRGDVPMAVEYAVIRDSTGMETVGHGPGFPVPVHWAESISAGVSLGELTEETHPGYAGNTVDALSQGTLSRERCVTEALLCAMIPRLNPETYSRQCALL